MIFVYDFNVLVAAINKLGYSRYIAYNNSSVASSMVVGILGRVKWHIGRFDCSRR